MPMIYYVQEAYIIEKNMYTQVRTHKPTYTLTHINSHTHKDSHTEILIDMHTNLHTTLHGHTSPGTPIFSDCLTTIILKSNKVILLYFKWNRRLNTYFVESIAMQSCLSLVFVLVIFKVCHFRYPNIS